MDEYWNFFILSTARFYTTFILTLYAFSKEWIQNSELQNSEITKQRLLQNNEKRKLF